MKVVFFGTPDFVIPVLERLVANFEVVGVVTTPDTIQGRKKILTPTPIKQYCIDTSLQTTILSPQQLNNEAIEQLKSLDPDLFVVAAYGHLIPESVLNIPKQGALNIHPSLLPKYRGPSPIQTAILNGETTSGISIIKMDEELDHGPIVAQEEFLFKETDTFESLHISMFKHAAGMLPRVIGAYVNRRIKPKEQDHSKATYCEHITKQDGYFDINNPPNKGKLDRMIRAYYPWPTAYSKLKIKNEKLKIVKFLPGNKIQLEGGKPMSIKDFLNGYPQMQHQIKKLFSS